MSVAFKHTTLGNGLTVIAEQRDTAHTAAVGFFVKVGTRDEPAELMGVSHFLEHMCFKGTDRRTADQVNQGFDSIGAEYNAMTSQESTVYYAHVLPEHLGEAVDLLGDILRPSLRDDDFDMEKQVILEEIGMYADRPFWVGYEHAMDTYFGDHPLGYRILGTNASIRSLSAESMRSFFNLRYSPDNIVVSLSGRLDFDATVAQLESLCGRWRPTGAQRYHAPVTPGVADRTHVDEKLTNQYVIAVSPAPAKEDDARYAAAVLSHVLGDDDGSRLYWELIDPGLAEEAAVSHQGFDGVGTFLSYAASSKRNAAQVEQKLLAVLDSAAADLTEEEVERARNKIAMDLMLQNERPAGRMMALGAAWQSTGQYRSLEEELSGVEAVTAASLQALVERYPFATRTIIRMAPGS